MEAYNWMNQNIFEIRITTEQRNANFNIRPMNVLLFAISVLDSRRLSSPDRSRARRVDSFATTPRFDKRQRSKAMSAVRPHDEE